MEELSALKETAAVIEGLARKLIAEHEYEEATFIAQTMVQYCRSFDRAYITLLAGKCKAQARVLDSSQGQESGEVYFPS
jgi:hypothetical protein